MMDDLCNRNEDFFGRFASIRSRLDYSFHAKYDQHRQKIQDAIISSFLSQGRPTTKPWAIFTAGPMGCGKTFVMNRLEQEGLLATQDFVRVDPDSLRQCLPEWYSLLAQDAERAGEHTQEEAGLMAEILTHAALGRGMSIIVDGSLRNSSWQEQHFRELRRLYPKLGLSIFYVTAPVAEIYKRVRERSRRTGRCVPPEVLEDSIQGSARSVDKLRHQVDFVLRIFNPSESNVQMSSVGAGLGNEERLALVSRANTWSPNDS